MSLKPNDYYDMDKWQLPGKRPILQRERKAITAIKQQVKKGGLLDVGCGDGQFLEEAASSLGKGWNFFGVDYSKFRLKQARAKNNFNYKWCNLEERIPYDDSTFNVVYSGEVIEHIYDPDKMLQECHRVLRKNGLLVISTPNFQAWYNRILFPLGVQPIFYEVSTKSAKIGAGPLKALKTQDVPVGHIRLFNKRALTDLLESEGFDVIDLQGAKFQSLPKWVQLVDGFFNVMPSLASNLVIVARKR